jgi:hypothetical protein
LLIAGLTGGFLLYKNQKTNVKPIKDGWQIYKNNRLEYSIQYPKDWLYITEKDYWHVQDTIGFDEPYFSYQQDLSKTNYNVSIQVVTGRDFDIREKARLDTNADYKRTMVKVDGQECEQYTYKTEDRTHKSINYTWYTQKNTVTYFKLSTNDYLKIIHRQYLDEPDNADIYNQMLLTLNVDY